RRSAAGSARAAKSRSVAWRSLRSSASPKYIGGLPPRPRGFHSRARNVARRRFRLVDAHGDAGKSRLAAPAALQHSYAADRASCTAIRPASGLRTRRFGMKIVAIGGTGLIGSKTVPILRQRGHEVVAASPNSGVNTITGEGLAAAMAG